MLMQSCLWSRSELTAQPVADAVSSEHQLQSSTQATYSVAYSSAVCLYNRAVTPAVSTTPRDIMIS
jgi:hypothetical protein